MKASKGFTLLEVVIALTITAILLPVIGISLYQVLVIPPKDNLQLTLTNEISLLSSQLSTDGYAANSFSDGVYPCKGNFSWTNTSTNISYVVSYYYDNSSNSIYRQVTNGTQSQPALVLAQHITNGTDFQLSFNSSHRWVEANITVNGNDSMGKLVTRQSTIYIAMRSSGTHSKAHDYYFDGGVGGSSTGQWAWSNGFSCSDFYGDLFHFADNILHCKNIPASHITPTNFQTSGFGCVAATNASGYSQIAKEGDEGSGGYWLTTKANGVAVRANAQLYTFAISENYSKITDIAVTWRGHGSEICGCVDDYLTQLWIFDYTHNSWLQLCCEQNFEIYDELNSHVTSGFSNYIQNGTGNVSVLVAAETSTPGCSCSTDGLWTDYIEVEVLGH